MPPSTFHLGFSGTFLDQPYTGSGQYACSLLREMVQLLEGPLTVFCPTGESARAAQTLLGEGRPGLASRWVLAPPPIGGNLGKVWYEQIGLPRAARAQGIDLLHVPYFGPPLASPCPVVVTIHDVVMRALPEHRGSLRVRLYTALAAAGARRARWVITDSAFSMEEVQRHLGIHPSRIQAVYLGCDERFQPVTEEGERSRVRQRYGLPESYVLYLGSLEPRKNVGALVRAWSEVPLEWTLVVAGGGADGGGRSAWARLAAEIERWGVGERVRGLGPVAEEEKPTLYSLAELFVFPSLYEGFGLPPLEAMSCGTPVLCSNATSLPEVVGQAALLFDPKDPEDLPRQLNALLRDEQRRREMGALGRRQAQSFRWRQTAQETHALYQEILSAASPA